MVKKFKYHHLRDFMVKNGEPEKSFDILSYHLTIKKQLPFLEDETLQNMGFYYIDGFSIKPVMMTWINPEHYSVLYYWELENNEPTLILSECGTLELLKCELNVAIYDLMVASDHKGSPQVQGLDIEEFL